MASAVVPWPRSLQDLPPHSALQPGVRRTVDPGNAGDVFSSAGPRSSNRWRGQVLRSAQMLPWLKAIVDWIFGRHSSLIQLSLQALNASGMSSNRRSGPDPPTRPYDPESPVRVPRRYGPTGRSASVAVAEPGDDENLMAIGSRIGDRPGVRRRSSTRPGCPPL
jgi:hypothetical protein